MAAANEVDPGQFVPVPRQGERASTTTSRAAAPAGRDVVTAPAQPQQPVAARDPQQVLLATLELDPPQAQIHGSEDHQRVAQSLFKAGQALLDRSRKRISILFFLIAIDFVIFDVEVAFLLPWILVLREGGWPLFWAVQVFILLILVGLAYIWKKGGLDLRPQIGIGSNARD